MTLSIKGGSETFQLTARPGLTSIPSGDTVILHSANDAIMLRLPAKLFPAVSPGDTPIVTIAVVVVREVEAPSAIIRPGERMQ